VLVALSPPAALFGAAPPTAELEPAAPLTASAALLPPHDEAIANNSAGTSEPQLE
jgi:hypothetical protein